MATVFWDSEGILLIDYLPRQTTMKGNYYAEVLGKKLEKAIKEKRKEKFKNGIFLCMTMLRCTKLELSKML
jgi:hypothetical protein